MTANIARQKISARLIEPPRRYELILRGTSLFLFRLRK